MKRRTLLLAAGAALAAVGLRPADHGAPYSSRFDALNALLKAEGQGRPVMVIDLDVLDRNIVALQGIRRPDTALRLVEKSLPSPGLLAYLQVRLGTRDLMSFHLPFLQQDAEHFPDSNLLLGKPLPVAAAAAFYAHGIRSAFNPATQLAWLIDTDARLMQYQQLAQVLGIQIRVALEIDVGLHRGGLPEPRALAALLARIQADPTHLHFAGLMGYDAQVGKLPALIETREVSHEKAVACYQGFVGAIRELAPGLINEHTVFNGAGSPTIALHQRLSACNDLAAGSCLLKPTDFDLPTLSDFAPAAFIAAPVIKASEGIMIPGIEAMGGAMAAWDPNQRRSYFLYGGRWMAQATEPQGLQVNGLYGASSNQMLFTGSAKTGLMPDDHVFFRPTQSEAVLLQFGDLLAVRGQAIEARWPVLRETV